MIAGILPHSAPFRPPGPLRPHGRWVPNAALAARSPLMQRRRLIRRSASQLERWAMLATQVSAGCRSPEVCRHARRDVLAKLPEVTPSSELAPKFGPLGMLVFPSRISGRTGRGADFIVSTTLLAREIRRPQCEAEAASVCRTETFVEPASRTHEASPLPKVIPSGERGSKATHHSRFPPQVLRAACLSSCHDPPHTDGVGHRPLPISRGWRFDRHNIAPPPCIYV